MYCGRKLEGASTRQAHPEICINIQQGNSHHLQSRAKKNILTTAQS